MKRKQIRTILVVVGFCIVVLIGIRYIPHHANRTHTSSHITQTTSASASTVKTKRPSLNSPVTDHDVVGVWINHHNKDIHQQITFTADYRWTENQHNVTNIYSGTWKIIGQDEIQLAPYGEKIQLYGRHYKQMNVLNYNHILNKQ
ncbi:hypothetical protein ACFQ5M_02455 [Agrilactobacillus yilanensis]|uniref:DUF3642 domain-containing protein n=1 Tax=Agrilactobacillus yilanensis TaxID=2485997 RepID=A0ABW4J659_9LACO|nr:hypothetical protein [Agrilactobacillus yilanensis]